MAVSQPSKEDKVIEGCGVIVAAALLLAAEAYLLYRVLNSFHPGALTYLQSLGSTYLFGTAARRFRK